MVLFLYRQFVLYLIAKQTLLTHRPTESIIIQTSDTISISLVSKYISRSRRMPHGYLNKNKRVVRFWTASSVSATFSRNEQKSR